MEFSFSLAILLIGSVLLIPKFSCHATTCPPPDFPHGGRYKPEKAEYVVGQKIKYFCALDRIPFYETNIMNQEILVACETTGKWSKATPFCDFHTKLKNPFAVWKQEMHSIIIDGDADSCFHTNERKLFVAFSVDYESHFYCGVLCFRKGNATIKFTMYGKKEYVYNVFTDLNNETSCTILPWGDNTDFIVVQVSIHSKSFMLCEIEVFSLNENLCIHPPKSILNGQLEVNRSKAVLHCNDGFREKEGKDIYATCESSKWLYHSLECVDYTPEDDSDISDIIVGSLIFLVILILFGLTMFMFLIKKTGVTIAVFKHCNRNSSCILSAPGGSGRTNISEIETTTL